MITTAQQIRTGINMAGCEPVTREQLLKIHAQLTAFQNERQSSLDRLRAQGPLADASPALLATRSIPISYVIEQSGIVWRGLALKARSRTDEAGNLVPTSLAISGPGGTSTLDLTGQDISLSTPGLVQTVHGRIQLVNAP